jgi:O-antigen chain-terminating bifunctional methyltransferase/kinase
MSDETSALADAVSRLPELYQPIFEHPELGIGPSRVCDDRPALLVPIYEALSSELGRPPRVLDLGCSQGYFSLHWPPEGARNWEMTSKAERSTRT